MTGGKKLNKKLKNVYKTKTVETQRELYRTWAGTYEADSVREFGYIGFETGAAAFADRVLDRDARILDAGCGTGLSGRALHAQGFTNLHGVDLSPEMLDVARESGIYQTLGEADLTQPLDIDEPYDAVYSAGVFGFGPPHPEHIQHVVAAVKAGGLAILTVNGKGWADCGWDEKLPGVIGRDGLDLQERFEIPYITKEDIPGFVLVFRR